MSPHAIPAEANPLIDLNKFAVTRNAFLPADSPCEVLSDACYQPWEIIAQHLPQHIEKWRRAYVILAFMTHAYVWGGDQPEQILPPQITIPFLQVSEHLELPPVLSYAAANLWNFASTSNDFTDLTSLRTLCSFTGTESESWFLLISVAMEARGAEIINTMTEAIGAIRTRDYETITTALEQLRDCIRGVGILLDRMYERCDPMTFYHKIRPFLAGSKNMASAGLPKGVFYDEGNGKGEWRHLRGGSNGQSSMIQFFDVVLGVDHKGNGDSSTAPVDKSFHAEVREYMPGPHARFLVHLSRMGSIRELALLPPSTPEQHRLRAAYTAATEALTEFRNKHIQIVTRYIVLPSRQSTSNGARKNLASSSSTQKTTQELTGTAWNYEIQPLYSNCAHAVPGSASWASRKEAEVKVVERVHSAKNSGDDCRDAEAKAREAYEEGEGKLVPLPPFYDQVCMPKPIRAEPILERYLRFPVEERKTYYLCASVPEHCKILWDWSWRKGQLDVWVELPDTAHPHFSTAQLGSRKLYWKMWEWMREESEWQAWKRAAADDASAEPVIKRRSTRQAAASAPPVATTQYAESDTKKSKSPVKSTTQKAKGHKGTAAPDIGHVKPQSKGPLQTHRAASNSRDVTPNPDPDTIPRENPDVERHDGQWYWLMKAEPETRMENGHDVRFSIDDLRACDKPEGWDGIRNYAARNNLRAMNAGDMAFFYHSNCKVPGIVGTMEIVREASEDTSARRPGTPYYDPKSTKENPKWSLVHVEFRRKFAVPIALPELRDLGKDNGPLANMQMLKLARMSVSKVSKQEWEALCPAHETSDRLDNLASVRDELLHPARETVILLLGFLGCVASSWVFDDLLFGRVFHDFFLFLSRVLDDLFLFLSRVLGGFFLFGRVFHDLVLFLGWVLDDFFLFLSRVLDNLFLFLFLGLGRVLDDFLLFGRVFHDFVLFLGWVLDDFFLAFSWVLDDLFLFFSRVLDNLFLFLGWVFDDFLFGWVLDDLFLFLSRVLDNLFLFLFLGWVFDDLLLLFGRVFHDFFLFLLAFGWVLNDFLFLPDTSFGRVGDLFFVIATTKDSIKQTLTVADILHVLHVFPTSRDVDNLLLTSSRLCRGSSVAARRGRLDAIEDIAVVARTSGEVNFIARVGVDDDGTLVLGAISCAVTSIFDVLSCSSVVAFLPLVSFRVAISSSNALVVASSSPVACSKKPSQTCATIISCCFSSPEQTTQVKTASAKQVAQATAVPAGRASAS
ncbi:uncharacterized protein J7T54_006654 [Emericellopsis cladophorae]|uniref:Thymocyte nuclear protein 1 n=1 Tax=Emericellopsis cladophorae TaxID=2686198 RepID=A0A9Q0BHP0_9HYPO|nr:uncharacterized protein J7T54_006654 [Emericellopsis cladophorae]KAI6784609.1 hypothetical protein J7T54_006654 [Emericellopsis cladophorae]